MVDHPLGRYADLVDPERARLAVGGMHRHPQSVTVERENAGDELPRPVDGVFLEVAAEAEVAEHLEQRLVARGIADVLKIVVLATGPHAQLAGRRAVESRALAPRQRVLELHHAGVGEQQRRIVAWNQAAGLDDLVATSRKEVEVSGSNLGSFHRRDPELEKAADYTVCGPSVR